MHPKDQALEVYGDFACFSRPEMRVERFSYPVITPSAARGIFDAIYCKPLEFRWQITRVEVLKQPNYIALRRNEVKDKINPKTVFKWMNQTQEVTPIWADGDKAFLGTDMKGRTQRQTMALKDVAYRLHAEIRPWPGFERKIKGLENQFRRRARHGKCVWQPYFGCREFPAFFELIEPNQPSPQTADYDQDLGLMLYDVFDLSRPGQKTDKPFISLFRGQVKQGVLNIPPFESPEVIRLQGGGHA
jgi:CRISPR-associated protein Cas5d